MQNKGQQPVIFDPPGSGQPFLTPLKGALMKRFSVTTIVAAIPVLAALSLVIFGCIASKCVD
jgi:hypothetical protein